MPVSSLLQNPAEASHLRWQRAEDLIQALATFFIFPNRLYHGVASGEMLNFHLSSAAVVLVQNISVGVYFLFLFGKRHITIEISCNLQNEKTQMIL